MLNYQRTSPTKLYFGKGQISHLEEALKSFGKNVLLTYGGGSIKKIGLYDEVMKILNKSGFRVTELSGIDPNPRIESVAEGVRLCREQNIDVILAVGGGSTLDCSKAIAVGTYYEGDDMWEMVVNAEGIAEKALPLVTILTLSATGSEYDGGGVISNMNTNQKLGRSYTYPAVSICDPTYTFSVSPYQTAAGSADIMSHIIEDYFSRTDDSDLSDGIAETILRSVMKNCPIAIKEPDNYSARANLMTNSSIACSGIPAYGKQETGWPCHAMEHELSAFYDITHGVGLAILTPVWMEYVLDESSVDKFAEYAKNVWDVDDNDKWNAAREGIRKTRECFTSWGMPTKLSELDIDDRYFRDMAQKAAVRGLDSAYKPLFERDIVNILKRSL